MAAYELAIQNFSVAEHLLQLYELFKDLHEETISEELRLAVCRQLGVPTNTALREAKNNQLILAAKAVVTIPHAFLVQNGADFLLRQAVVVACTSVESFFWDSLRENVLTVVRARRRKADDSIRNLSLTIDDYLSLENYSDPDDRLRQIILRNFERGTLYDTSSIEEIANILTVKDFWNLVADRCGVPLKELRRNLDDLIQRRNHIAHRADRPNLDSDPPEEQDCNGLRAIHYAWVNPRLANAKSVINAANEIFQETLGQLEQQLTRQKEQELAQQTVKRYSQDS